MSRIENFLKLHPLIKSVPKRNKNLLLYRIEKRDDMVTKSRSGASYNRLLCTFAGLSTDTKPIEKFSDTSGEIYIENGSEFIEMDTSKKSLYNAENKQWEEV